MERRLSLDDLEIPMLEVERPDSRGANETKSKRRAEPATGELEARRALDGGEQDLLPKEVRDEREWRKGEEEGRGGKWATAARARGRGRPLLADCGSACQDPQRAQGQSDELNTTSLMRSGR